MDEKCVRLLNSINESLKAVVANQAMLFCQIRNIEKQMKKEGTGMEENAPGDFSDKKTLQ